MDHSCSYRYSIKNPDLRNTGYIVAIANIEDKHDRSTPSHYHWKILKCRMIIFSNSSILACPDKEDVKKVHIVFNKVGDDYDKLNSLFIKFSLRQDGAIRSTTPEIFKMCFTYTMTAKIAPTWNVLGFDYLVNNRDFLTTNGIQEGVKYQIVSDEFHTDLTLKPVNINIIKATEDIAPGEYVRVLPSLNKAVVEECSKTLPEIGSFKSYKDIRRHWKNIHGYRLPDDETSYYMIRFWRGEPLTYPDICVTRHFPIITPMPRPREEIVLSRFVSCLKSKIPHFLGIPMTIKIKETMELIKVADGRTPVPQTQDHPISLCTPTQNLRQFKY
ncbi:uncharacterized protein C18orf63-like [Cydia fagiglandana]|uniref:uncharacterized protein C18orf63-like n=1 Tax=Cydia fagiglandana TaxID=1458189 RepID=UPI002FEE55F5